MSDTCVCIWNRFCLPRFCTAIFDWWVTEPSGDYTSWSESRANWKVTKLFETLPDNDRNSVSCTQASELLRSVRAQIIYFDMWEHDNILIPLHTHPNTTNIAAKIKVDESTLPTDQNVCRRTGRGHTNCLSIMLANNPRWWSGQYRWWGPAWGEQVRAREPQEKRKATV